MGALGVSTECLDFVWKVSVCVYRNFSEERTVVSEASKLPAGARISKGPVGPLKF